MVFSVNLQTSVVSEEFKLKEILFYFKTSHLYFLLITLLKINFCRCNLNLVLELIHFNLIFGIWSNLSKSTGNIFLAGIGKNITFVSWASKKKQNVNWWVYKIHYEPRERFELSTPGLQDQCSNHWANEADMILNVTYGVWSIHVKTPFAQRDCISSATQMGQKHWEKLSKKQTTNQSWTKVLRIPM